MRKLLATAVLAGSVLSGAVPGARGEGERPADPAGVLRKPIPDKLVVLTFDDGPLSGYTVVAPILKSYGFNGSFYVCDFDSFKTRKDWYMTWRQMKAMADAGFEIGNHSKGHSPGFDAMMKMEDALLANHVPKPTTIAWPLHQANVTPELAAAGYIFARGGHNRAYRPTVDNPFEIPSMWCNDLDGFVKMVRQAAGGKIVAICYHGVPDMEHPPVSLAPEVFKVQMQYLKDNHYKVIALRDLVEYIDPAKAAKLPPTAKDFKDPGPVILASEEKPCGAVKPVVPEAGNARHAPAEKPKQIPPAAAGVVTPIDKSRPNVFTWSKAEGGNWSDAAKWSNSQGAGAAPAAAGRADYVLNFDPRGTCAVKNDLQAGFLLHQLVLGDGCGGLVLGGNGITFAKASASSIAPEIRAGKCQRVDINVPVTLQDDLSVNTFPDKDPNCFISFNEVIAGPRALILNSTGDPNVAGINFHDVHFGILQLNNSNTYSGGTRINGGKIIVRKNDGLGTGPVTLDQCGTLSTEGTLANPLVINSGTLFHCALSGPVTLNCIANFISDCDISGTMSGPGGFTLLGTNGTYLSMVPGGTVTLRGSNTYSGPTTVFPGTLIVKKAAGLYNGNATQWTPSNLTVHKSATLRLNVGGPGEFTGAQISALLTNLTTKVSGNGLMAGSVLSLDTADGSEPVTVAANMTDSKGPGGGAFLVKKCGPGALRLSGNNTYTGQTILECGTLIVNSLNSYTKGNAKPGSSLGVPMDIEAGEIVMGDDGKDGDCALIYTGPGETSDRVINLAGKLSTVTLTQSGTGLLKLTSSFVISGFGANKTIALAGNSAGTGELAGTITNPHDRAGKATTSLTKSGKGTWTLSGTNGFTGPTLVTGGTLALTNAGALGADTEVSVAEGATLSLDFKGAMQVGKLTLGGKAQAPGKHGAAGAAGYLKGTGVLNVGPARMESMPKRASS